MAQVLFLTFLNDEHLSLNHETPDSNGFNDRKNMKYNIGHDCDYFACWFLTLRIDLVAEDHAQICVCDSATTWHDGSKHGESVPSTVAQDRAHGRSVLKIVAVPTLPPLYSSPNFTLI